MDEKVLNFYCQDEYLKRCHEEGKDIYAAFASRIFKVPYEECQEWKDSTIYLPGKARRQTAKNILCACYVCSTGEMDPFVWLNVLENFLPGLTY